MGDRVRVGMGQMHVMYSDLTGNLQRAGEMAKAAAKSACDVLVLPECMDIGWGNAQAQEMGMSIPGAAFDYLHALAVKYRIHIVSGLTEKTQEGVYNAAVLFDDCGRFLLHTRKIHILDVEKMYTRGQSLHTADTVFGRVGVFICADAFYKDGVLCDAMAALGADIVLSPCAWAVPSNYDVVAKPYGWENIYGPAAAKHNMPMIGVSHVGLIGSGAWINHLAIGSSLAMGKGGIVVQKASYGQHADGLFIADIGLGRKKQE